jgi:hypothetical protein
MISRTFKTEDRISRHGNLERGVKLDCVSDKSFPAKIYIHSKINSAFNPSDYKRGSTK